MLTFLLLAPSRTSRSSTLCSCSAPLNDTNDDSFQGSWVVFLATFPVSCLISTLTCATCFVSASAMGLLAADAGVWTAAAAKQALSISPPTRANACCMLTSSSMSDTTLTEISVKKDGLHPTTTRTHEPQSRRVPGNEPLRDGLRRGRAAPDTMNVDGGNGAGYAVGGRNDAARGQRRLPGASGATRPHRDRPLPGAAAHRARWHGAGLQGWDPQLSRPVAIKVLQVGRRQVDDVRSRLRREAQALARLTHPNVVEVYDVEVGRGSLCIVMELVEGQTLHLWLQERPRWSTVVDVMLEAAHGLSAAHRAGLIHRDFKPANVMIRESDRRVLVMDFGLARALDSTDEAPWERESSGDVLSDSITRHGEIVGTPAYMSPEQQRGHPISDATDQFSFCVALFEALHGVRPFRAATRRQLFKEKNAGRFEHPRDTDVPRQVRRWSIGAWPSIRSAAIRGHGSR